MNLWLSQQVLAGLIAEAEQKSPNETGGILLGYRAPATSEPVVTAWIGPGPNAIHESDRFAPDHHFQSDKLAQLYAQSRRTLNYLGDWHTHPGGAGYLSQKDKAVLRQIATHRRARAPRPLMLILAPGPCWIPHIWQGELIRAAPCVHMLRTTHLRIVVFAPEH